MIIQHIVFPNREFNPVVEAFMRLRKCRTYRMNDTTLTLDANARVDFNTYFNGYSVSKWSQYTTIRDVFLHISLSGCFEITLCNEYRSGNSNLCKQLQKLTFDSEAAQTEELDIPIPNGLTKGIVSFQLRSLQDGSVFRGGYYYTTQEEKEFVDVSFAVDICTFKREAFLTRNLDLLERTVLCEGSPLKDKFEFFISDNGQTFSLTHDYDGRVHVFPNKNAGGAGGFGRAMIEILRSPNYEKFTHVIMMDDDIVISPETLYRTYVMAKTLKPEHKDAFIGGAMLKLDEPGVQSENMDLWQPMGHRPVKYNYDITSLDFVLKNEIEDKGNYLGWWYCAMPIGVVKANNLPLPIFIKRDDIEFGIRNGRTFITLNGLCVLHEAFGNKRQGYLEYYYWRNMCILNAIHFPSYGGNALKGQLRGVLKKALISYRYDDANLAFTGVEDFLKGVDWLKQTDVEALNQYVLSYTYRAQPISQLNYPVSHGAFEKAVNDQSTVDASVKRSRSYRLSRRYLAGWLFKATTPSRYVGMNNPPASALYRVKTAINYDEENNRAFITRKSYRQAWNLYKNYRYICKQIDKKYDEVKEEYRNRYRELISLKFWDSYLGITEPISVPRDFPQESAIKSEAMLLQEDKEKRVLKRDAKFLHKVQLFRFAQYFLFWLPQNRKRVAFYLHQRKGYTCNLKYIAEELHRQFGDKLDIVWITRYPECCHQLEEKGFRVVALNSLQHWYYQFTARVVVINDAFPEITRVRKGQLTINTWHAGMNYKHIGGKYVHFRNRIARKLFNIRNKQPKVYLSGSRFFTEDTSESFGFNPQVFLPAGMARNDIFFRDNQELARKIKQYYALPQNCKLVLYAPTFRLGYQEDQYGLNFDQLLESLSQRFGGNWRILYRKHYFVNGKDSVLNRYTIDVSDYEDMNELLAVSDVLISDYSSCLWDFALTKRPSFVYATDIDSYQEKDRDFAYPLDKWPFDIARCNEELREFILNFDEKDYVQRVEQHLKDGGSYDDGHASERAVEIIAKKLKLQK